jgi:hypothetical protein
VCGAVEMTGCQSSNCAAVQETYCRRIAAEFVLDQDCLGFEPLE